VILAAVFGCLHARGTTPFRPILSSAVGVVAGKTTAAYRTAN